MFGNRKLKFTNSRGLNCTMDAGDAISLLRELDSMESRLACYKGRVNELCIELKKLRESQKEKLELVEKQRFEDLERMGAIVKELRKSVWGNSIEDIHKFLAEHGAENIYVVTKNNRHSDKPEKYTVTFEVVN